MKTKTRDIKISGVQKTSLIDYPEYIAAVIFTQGCNFTCPYCHNPELIARKNEDDEYVDTKMFLDFMVQRKHLLDGVSITGGEPLLQEGLHEFIAELKVNNFKVKLDTNGSRAERLKALLEENLVDYIAMDFKLPFTKYNQVFPAQKHNSNFIKNIKESLSLILESGVKHEFRTTVVPGMHEIEDIREIAESIKGAEQYFIQNFRPQKTLNPELEKLKQFPPAKLQDFRNTARKYLKKVNIRS